MKSMRKQRFHHIQFVCLERQQHRGLHLLIRSRFSVASTQFSLGGCPGTLLRLVPSIEYIQQLNQQSYVLDAGMNSPSCF